MGEQTMTYKNIEAHQLESLLQEGPITIMDMRDLTSFNGGHLDGALPANDFVIDKLIRENNKVQNVLVYCYLGNSSKDLCTLLGKLGFTGVHNLVGGYTAWKKFCSQNNAEAATV